jgi:mono/diheme cytochrome c family protein
MRLMTTAGTPMSRRTRALTLALVLALPAMAAAQEDERARRVYDIIKANCLECHGESRKGNLDLRTHDSLTKGGASGRVVVPHEPQKSRLYLLVSHADPDDVMPFKRPKLADDDIEVIRQWIEDGASLEAVEDAVPEEKRAPATLAKLEERPIRPQEREYWAFQKPQRPIVPVIAPMPAHSANGSSRPSTNPIDAFLLAAMANKGVTPATPADRPTLIRRAYLDVIGLPPTPAEVDAFVNDRSLDAWPKLVDKLLASPHYGERWARHWLDLVRYADSGGFEFDVDRREMWRYRDYVVKSLNTDKPYSQFVREQIAGDEYAPGSDEAMIATGFLRLGPEGGGGGERGRQDALEDVIATTTLTFTGLTVACARCHNHKFDPIPQKDYYRIQSVFYSTRPTDHPLVPAHQVQAHRVETARIDALLRPLRQAKRALEAPYLKQLVDREIAQLPEYLQAAWKTPAAERTDGQRLNVAQIERTLQMDSLRAKITEEHIVALMPPDVKAKHAAVKAEIEVTDEKKPRPYPTARAITEGAREPRPSYFLHRGSIDAKGSLMTPGVLSVVGDNGHDYPLPPPDAKSSWRRRGFAEWLVSPDNPLTARVMVNRLWQHHFGEGIVRTPSNFGKMGELPSHPELLDWLAVEFVDKGWSLKAMHRLMLTSEAYQRSSRDITANVAIDPGNQMFWRMPRQRLEAEAVRDLILATSGALDRKMGGPNVFPYIDPDLFEASSKRNWPGKPDSDPSTWRRSLYVFSKRSIRYPLFEAFDQPNLVNSVDRRNRSTVAPQALLLMNNAFVLFQSEKFAERLRREAGSHVARQIDRAFRVALARPPDAVERQKAIQFVRQDGLAAFCHVLFNLNEFVYRQ